jgi:hypothetical protein
MGAAQSQIQVGKWVIREDDKNGFLEILPADLPREQLANADVPYFRFSRDGNINIRRFAQNGDINSGWISDEFVRWDRPFALQSSRGGYLTDAGGWQARPNDLHDHETMIPRKAFPLGVQPAEDKVPVYAPLE